MTHTTTQPSTSTEAVQIDKESLQVLVSTAQMYGPGTESIEEAVEHGTSALDTSSQEERSRFTFSR